MNYPLISEYIEAIKSAEDNFEELTNLRPVLGDDGQPVMTSGNFAVVFKMEDMKTGKFYALKCFTKEQEGRAEAYHQIADALKDVDSPYLVSLRYLDKELFVDTEQTAETEFPVLLMDWVEGKTLDKYLRENLDDKYALEMLAYRFSQLSQWLIPQPLAHGDLKPDNILVREDGTLVLVDYDGMYVPAMKGQKARELGSPDFRHPLRTENDFDEHIDDFPMASILLSLKIMSFQPDFMKKYGSSDRLLFSEIDYREISKCRLLKELFPSGNPDLNVMMILFMFAFEKTNLSDVSFRLLYPSSPQVNEPENLSTKVMKEDFANVWIDEYGVKYSADKKKLLGCPIEENIRGSHVWKKGILKGSYKVLQGTLYICDKAFFNCTELTTVYLPNSVKKIGNSSFAYCSKLVTLKLNDGLMEIGNDAFKNCKSLRHVLIPESLISIGNSIFEESGVQYILSFKGDKKRIQSLFPHHKDIIEELPY